MNKKKVLVTGGTRGIGKSVSELFAKNNYIVHITGTKEIELPTYVDNFYLVDFSNNDSFNSFLKQIENEKYDVLVNNAGINIIKENIDVSFDDWDKINNVNLKAPYFLIKEIVKNMNIGGKIINVSSIFGFVSKEKRSLYSTTKFGIQGFTKALSIEFGDKNILVNTVSPGFTNTELTEKSLNKEQSEELKSQIPLNRFAETYEIAELIYFLGSEKNTYITGQNIIIDGGFTSK
jgi:3-oxoacyl-[acyl-carrier protein] reductase